MTSKWTFDQITRDQVRTVVERENIVDSLQRLAQVHTEFAITAMTHGACLQGRMLSLDEERDQLVFAVEAGTEPGAATDESFLHCFETTHAQGWVGFTATPNTIGGSMGRLFWTVPLPRSVVCLQRRMHSRTRIPSLPMLTCHVPINAHGTGTSTVRASVMDISWGGIALLTYARGFPLVAAARYPGCRLMLTPRDSVEVTIEVVAVTAIVDASGKQALRVNCKWVCPSGWALAQIQRYIVRYRDEGGAEHAIAQHPAPVRHPDGTFRG